MLEEFSFDAQTSRLTENLAEVMESVDYICSVLPSTPSTRGLLDGDILKTCAKKVNETQI